MCFVVYKQRVTGILLSYSHIIIDNFQLRIYNIHEVRRYALPWSNGAIGTHGRGR